MTSLKTRTTQLAHGVRRGFTLIEVVIVSVILVILAALVLVAMSQGVRFARKSADQGFLRSISLSVDAFKEQFGFLPPMVNDAAGPLVNDTAYGTRRPLILGQDATGVWPTTDPALLYGSNGRTAIPRYSNYSLSYYLLGSLGRAVDGVDGVGFTKPDRNGHFARNDQRYAPLLDLANLPERLRASTNGETDILVDRYAQPVRYYRWEALYQTATDPQPGRVKFSNAPAFLGDPRTEPRLRQSGYALVAVGADGNINAGVAADAFNTDNILEIGQ